MYLIIFLIIKMFLNISYKTVRTLKLKLLTLHFIPTNVLNQIFYFLKIYVIDLSLIEVKPAV